MPLVENMLVHSYQSFFSVCKPRQGSHLPQLCFLGLLVQLLLRFIATCLLCKTQGWAAGQRSATRWHRSVLNEAQHGRFAVVMQECATKVQTERGDSRAALHSSNELSLPGKPCAAPDGWMANH